MYLLLCHLITNHYIRIKLLPRFFSETNQDIDLKLKTYIIYI